MPDKHDQTVKGPYTLAYETTTSGPTLSGPDVQGVFTLKQDGEAQHVCHMMNVAYAAALRSVKAPPGCVIDEDGTPHAVLNRKYEFDFPGQAYSRVTFVCGPLSAKPTGEYVGDELVQTQVLLCKAFHKGVLWDGAAFNHDGTFKERANYTTTAKVWAWLVENAGKSV